MNYLYLLLNLASLSVPFIFSFHPKLKFYKQWKSLFLGILVSMLIFIPWDIIFTSKGIWGFNNEYFLGIKLFHLPIEEWLFFICIPYACVFTHISILEINPKLSISDIWAQRISIFLFVLFGSVLLFNYDKAYTAVDMAFAMLVLAVVKKFNPKLLTSFYITFLFMLIPFFIVNGVLTGTGIEGNIVWYNDEQNLGIRLGTIPIEDTAYAFSLILMNLFLFYEFKKKFL